MWETGENFFSFSSNLPCAATLSESFYFSRPASEKTSVLGVVISCAFCRGENEHVCGIVLVVTLSIYRLQTGHRRWSDRTPPRAAVSSRVSLTEDNPRPPESRRGERQRPLAPDIHYRTFKCIRKEFWSFPKCNRIC